MARQARPQGKRWGVWLFVAVVVVFLGFLVVGSMRTVQAECSLCVECRGQRQCRTGAGATVDNAQRAAQKAACAVMAAGMNESIACQRLEPINVQCSG